MEMQKNQTPSTLSDLAATTPAIASKAQVVESYVTGQIQYRLDRLKKLFKLRADDLEDVHQSLLLAVISGIRQYCPEKGGWRTYITAICDNCYCHHLRRLEAQARLAVKNTAKLEDMDEDHDLTPGYLQDNDTPIDVASIISTLSPDLAQITELLKKYSPAEISRMLNLGKATVARRIEKIKKHFLAAGYGLQQD